MEKNCIIRNQLRRTPVSLFAARILDYLSPEMLFCPTIADQSGLIFFRIKIGRKSENTIPAPKFPVLINLIKLINCSQIRNPSINS